MLSFRSLSVPITFTVAVNSTKFHKCSVLGQLFRTAEPIGLQDGVRLACVCVCVCVGYRVGQRDEVNCTGCFLLLRGYKEI